MDLIKLYSNTGTGTNITVSLLEDKEDYYLVQTKSRTVYRMLKTVWSTTKPVS